MAAIAIPDGSNESIFKILHELPEPHEITCRIFGAKNVFDLNQKEERNLKLKIPHSMEMDLEDPTKDKIKYMFLNNSNIYNIGFEEAKFVLFDNDLFYYDRVNIILTKRELKFEYWDDGRTEDILHILGHIGEISDIVVKIEKQIKY